MKTSFTLSMEWYNSLINTTKVGGKCYRLLVKAKYHFIKNYDL